MMVGKKSLGFHCWSEKGEVILVRQGRERTTPKMAGKCVVSHRIGTPLGAGWGGAWEQRWGLARYLFVSLLPLLAWLGFEVGHVSSLFQLLKVAFLVTLAHQIEWFTRGQHHLEHCSRYT